MKNIPFRATDTLKGFGSLLIIGAITAIVGFSGCATPRTTSRTIQIESEPSGMRVEVNGAHLGNTPTSYAVKTNSKGDFAGAAMGDSPLIMFTAFPPEGGKDMYKQMKTFSPSAFMDRGDRVPEKIFFDMHNVSGR
ncbi:MAG: hypothetical protein K0Q55_1828 [Verrucomicrobia bacterium]|jgi:hypothetical protein|nr:hypothetical protein [Verrucomicrobiota bacterium]